MFDIQRIAEEREKSPLEKKLDRAAVILTQIGLVRALFTFVMLFIVWVMNSIKMGRTNKMANVLVDQFIIAVTIFI
jgi:magnesium-transporting ATPase (P-type)